MMCVVAALADYILNYGFRWLFLWGNYPAAYIKLHMKIVALCIDLTTVLRNLVVLIKYLINRKMYIENYITFVYSQ